METKLISGALGAEIKGISLEEVATITSSNAKNLFKI